MWKSLVGADAWFVSSSVFLLSDSLGISQMEYVTFNKLNLTWEPEKILSRTFGFFATAHDLKTHLAEFKRYGHIFTHDAFYSF